MHGPTIFGVRIILATAWLCKVLEEFQNLLLLIQRRNSACKPPVSLRKRCGASRGSGRFDHCLWQRSATPLTNQPLLKPRRFQKLRTSKPRSLGSGVRSQVQGTHPGIRQLLTAVAHCRPPVIQSACGAAMTIL